MKNNIFTFIISLIILSSCTGNKTKVYLRAESVEGLTDKSKVTARGLEIGQIENLELGKQGGVLIEIALNKDIELPEDSEFGIESTDLLGTKEIKVEPGKSENFIKTNDTIIIADESLFPTDMVKNTVGKFINNLMEKDVNDSLATELKKLNKNIRELVKENKE